MDWKSLPILGAILKILSSESVILAIVTVISSNYLGTHVFDNLIAYVVLGAGFLIVGLWELGDFRKGLAKHRMEIETLLKEALHAKIDIPLKDGRVLTIDVPDEIEAPLLKEIIKAIVGD